MEPLAIMKLNGLPNECLLELFTHIPLHRQTCSHQLVCKRWREIHLLFCRGRSTILALVGDVTTYGKGAYYVLDSTISTIQCHADYHLTFREGARLTPEIVDHLVNKFSVISKLELIHLNSCPEISQSIRLLQALGGGISRLKYSHYNHNITRPEGNVLVHEIIDTILDQGNLPALRCLTLDIYAKFWDYQFFHDPDLNRPIPITIDPDLKIHKNDLSHLQEFRLLRQPMTILKKLFGNDPNSSISAMPLLHRLTIGREALHLYRRSHILDQMAPSYFPQLSHLSFPHCGAEQIRFVSQHCSPKRLTHLRLTSMPNHQLTKVATELGQPLASHLVHFRIDFDFVSTVWKKSPTLYLGVNIFWHATPDLSHVPIFHSTRVLHLSAHPSYGPLIAPQEMAEAGVLLATLFPRLELLIIEDASGTFSIPTISAPATTEEMTVLLRKHYIPLQAFAVFPIWGLGCN